MLSRTRALVASALGLTLLMAGAQASNGQSRTLSGPIPAVVTRIVDGDTIEVRAHVWIGHEILVRVRLAGVDVPEPGVACELGRQQATAARELVRREVEGARVTLSNVRGDKYFGRVVAEVRTPTGESLSGLLLDLGLGRPYQGRARPDPCREDHAVADAASGRQP